MLHIRLSLFFAACLGSVSVFAESRTEFNGDFAPAEGWVKLPEAEFRHEICLNGRWQFQPVTIPESWLPNRGTPPELSLPQVDAWETTPIKIPSAWNVNTWGNGRNVGAGTDRPYFPDSVYYPSYPEHWDGVRMAWMKRSFTLPEHFTGQRIRLHFEAVSGMAEIYVNGKKTGENFGRFLPFEVDITDAVQFHGKENELLVGVRSLRLFDKTSEKYSKMRTPYPPGSNMDNLNGIWEDVYLLAVPAIRIEDVFVKPFVHRDTLEIELTLKNDLSTPQTIAVEGGAYRWHNNADIKAHLIKLPEPDWNLDKTAALSFKRSKEIVIPAGKSITLTLSEKVGDKLKYWTMDEPNLYGLVLDVFSGGRKVDTKYTRFGWREFRIVGNNLELNSKPVKLVGDLLHPFGPYISSRRYVWSWYTMVKEMNGNAVRPHAQPHPRIYAELADEMGLAVLAETAMFGSSIQLNFEDDTAWDRYAEHYKKLILRDRNHPAVFGWSWGNELFAIFIYDKAITPEQTDIWYDKLAEYGKAGMQYDPTRNWYSCDGDGDMRGSMPVWNKHFGHGTGWKNELPDIEKPMMVGEQGGTYYARPKQLAEFSGDMAYESYRGRNEALAIDVYKNIVEIALPRLVFFSPAETAWFGIEHLNFGYHDFSRLPNRDDGVFFTKPYTEGKPGVQIERLPPYVCTFNPGFDPQLPLFKPLPMFEAQKAALAPGGPKPLPVPEYQGIKALIQEAIRDVDRVVFIGDVKGTLHERLTAIGVPLVPVKEITEAARIIIVDGSSPEAAKLDTEQLQKRLTSGGIVYFLYRESAPIPQHWADKITLREQSATQLYDRRHLYSADKLYFAEERGDRQIVKCVLSGDFVRQGIVMLETAAVDWSLFNEQPESAKCAAICLYEAVTKKGAVWVLQRADDNGFAFVTLDVFPDSPKNVALWKRVFYTVKFADSQPQQERRNEGREHDLLLDGTQ
ncbi:MAG: hypothetical protein LBI05_06285 [Planctomycetaceae bacterium]|jgi:beta-galactosidase|nr:hypothetical protein [Planctomycetaceae bacterium]